MSGYVQVCMQHVECSAGNGWPPRNKNVPHFFYFPCVITARDSANFFFAALVQQRACI